MARPKPALIDTNYIVALVNRSDRWHKAAVRWREWIIATGRRLVTTEYVLIEIGNGVVRAAVSETRRETHRRHPSVGRYQSRPRHGWPARCCSRTLPEPARQGLGPDRLRLVRRHGRARPDGCVDSGRALPPGRVPADAPRSPAGRLTRSPAASFRHAR